MKRIQIVFCRLILPVLATLFLITGIYAQEPAPIRWSIKTDATPVKAGAGFKIQVIATIDSGWHLYSLEQPEGGPIPTRISVPDNQKFKLNGDIETPQPQIVFDKNFNMDTQFYENEAVFILPVESSKDAATGKNTLTVSAFFQTCNDKMCLPPKVVKATADIDIMGGGGNSVSENTVKDSTAPTVVSQSSPTKSADGQAIEFSFVDFTGKPRKISEFRGKYVLLDFWATWCKPCLADIPRLKELYEKHKTSGFEIVGMDSETIGDDEGEPDPEFAKQTAARAKQIVATRGVTWTQATAETAVPTAKKVFKVTALPTKILLDKEGKIIATIGEKDDLTGIVEKLLQENK